MGRCEVVVVGAGGHARSLISVMKDEGIVVTAVYDESFDDPAFSQSVLDVPVLGGLSDVPIGNSVLAASGDNAKRERFARLVVGQRKCELAKYISKRATVSTWGVTVDDGSCVFPMVYVGPSARIGVGCIINTGAIVEHDTQIGDYSHISIGSTIAGSVSIGERCFVGAGATIIDKVTICGGVFIAAGTVVISNITAAGTYVGVPARRLTV